MLGLVLLIAGWWRVGRKKTPNDEPIPSGDGAD
jgi:hypothetical protein